MKPRKRPKPQVFYIAPGLDPKEAMRRAKKKATRDFRGSSYDRITGRIVLVCLTLLACGSTPETGLFDDTLSVHSTGGQSHSSASYGGIASSGIGSQAGLDTSTGGDSIDCLSGAKPPPQGQPWSPNCKADSDCAEMCQSRTALCLGWCECIGTDKTPCNTEYPHLTNQCYVGCPMYSECREGKDCVPP